MKPYFINFALYNLVFLIMQLAYSLSRGASFLHAVSLPWKVYFELLLTLLIQIILYFLLTLYQTFLLWAFYDSTPQKLQKLTLFIYAATLTAILTINCYFFPLSLFSKIFYPEIPSLIIQSLMAISLCFLGVLTLFAGSKLFLKKPELLSIGFVLILGVFGYSLLRPVDPADKPRDIGLKHLNPNIILIGIDSFSPERMNARYTPYINKFINTSVHFTNTISPLARTYPAWTTILTGLHPIHHHARENLIPNNLVNYQASLAWDLKRLGYKTLFASDDRRFNNLGNEFGFDQIIGPKMGVNDILLGSFYDFPLSNLLINTPISQWILPYNYLNRAAHFSYYPSVFDNALKKTITTLNQSKPLFFAVHFALPHWPYAWATSSIHTVGDEFNVNARETLYNAAIQQADVQIGKFLQVLEEKNILKNSLVILLSDHGEVLYHAGSRKIDREHYQGKNPSLLENYFKQNTSTDLDKSVGHGSDLLSPSQFHCVLAFKMFNQGKALINPKKINTRVALSDIAPTIRDFLHIPSSIKTNFIDGISLLPTLLHENLPPSARIFLLESGMFPNQFLTQTKAIDFAQLIFHVNKTNQLEIKPDQLDAINAMKIYGILQGDWLVALYPDKKHTINVILNLKNGNWSDDFNSKFAINSPAKAMLTKLYKVYTPAKRGKMFEKN